MDSNHDKVIQSHLVHDASAIATTFSVFRAAFASNTIPETDGIHKRGERPRVDIQMN